MPGRTEGGLLLPAARLDSHDFVVPAPLTHVDSDELTAALARFDGTPAERRVVARQARDLADAGLVERDRDDPLTVDVVLDELAGAPSGGPAARWNWWVGALEVAHGGYERFAVRRYDGD